MSKQKFGLRQNPFVAGHHPRLMYEGPGRREIVSTVRQAITDGEPFILVSGDSGVGKTSMVACALGDAALQAHAVFLTRPAGNRGELLEGIALAFGVDTAGHSQPRVYADLEARLRGLSAEGRRAVLVVDEAQSLTSELLEEVRLLSNLEGESGVLLQTILIGNPELERRLSRPELAQLLQRIAVLCVVRPLSAEECVDYIHHRVKASGGDAPALFAGETCVEIHRCTYGFPREINRLAQRALQRATRAKAARVTAEHVREALADARIRAPEVGHAEESAIPRRVATPAPAPDRPAPAPPCPATVPPTAPAAGVAADLWVPRYEEPAPEGGPHSPSIAASREAWIAHFVGAEGPPRIGSRVAGPLPEFVEDPIEAPAGLRQPSLAPRVAPRLSTTRGLPGTWIAGAALVVIAGLALVLLPRWMRSDDPAPGQRTETATSRTPATAGSPGRAETTAPTLGVAAPVPAPADSAPPPRPRRHGLEIGTFLDAGRAAEEAARLEAATGLSARVQEVPDGGATAYRLLLGSFPSSAEAEREADRIVSSGFTDQARVVRMPRRQRAEARTAADSLGPP